jgi:hypothetical protein
MSGMSGRCPSVTFSVRGTTIVVDSSTSFRRSSCGDLKNGRKVDGEGVRQSNGSIKATKLQVDTENDDGDQ